MAEQTLDYYLAAFEKMNRAVMRGVKAPHKPLLLLSILNLVKRNVIDSNQIQLSDGLVYEFKRLWLYYVDYLDGYDTIMVAEGLELDIPRRYPFKCSIENPFYHMQHEPFWRLIKKADIPIAEKKFYTSIKSLRMNFAYAEMDEELFEMMKDGEMSLRIKDKLLEIM